MGALPVLQKGRRVSLCLSNDKLPDFYMNDFSVMGLMVADLDSAHRIFEDKDIAVYRKADYLELGIDRADQLSEIITLLKHSGIDCDLTDIVDQIYQG